MTVFRLTLNIFPMLSGAGSCGFLVKLHITGSLHTHLHTVTIVICYTFNRLTTKV